VQLVTPQEVMDRGTDTRLGPAGKKLSRRPERGTVQIGAAQLLQDLRREQPPTPISRKEADVFQPVSGGSLHTS
jgi:hypothetical protein